ncbi:MAG: D-alanyl-D-alanine carboxypeptidase DacB precursor [Pelotomaculum sp. PtaU1.Bin035]|nr:MAG: D-alanyl-D-alanine carboxypeptidase DacB precursor [Pelotomaculum sp. PtaU1.Bin035]
MHTIRGLWAIWAIFLVLLAASPSQAAAAPEIVGGSAAVIDSKNGQVLFEKNMRQRMYPASTTKILTAIIALEKGRPADMVTISGEACNIEGSAIGLDEGEKISLEDLLYALMLNSGNDSAVAIASYIGGSVDGFVDLMNKKAAELGAVNTHFNNPNGLPDPNHYSTAYDMAVIARYAMQNPEFRKIVATETKDICREDPNAQTYLLNHNKLLWQYEGANGIKTGYTELAGQCLVASAARQGRELIAVVLGSEGTNIWSDAKVLLDYGFVEFNSVSVTEAGKRITDVPVRFGVSDSTPVLTSCSLTYDFPRNKQYEIRQEVRLKEKIIAPVEAGEKLGEVAFFANDREIGRVDLVSKQAVQRKMPARLWLYLFVALALFTVRAIFRYHKNRRRNQWLRFSKRKNYFKI